MKKALYISYDGMTDPLGQSQVLPYLLRLTQHGFHFTIISFEKKQKFEKEAGIIRSIIKDKPITWVPLTFHAHPPVLSKIYDRWRMRQTANRLHKQNRFDLVHCRSYVAAEIGLKLKKRFGVKFLFDMRGFWADEKMDNGQWDMGKTFYRKIYEHYKRKENEFLLNADGIISLTQAGKNYLLSKKEYSDLSIEVIPCCADLDHFDYHAVSAEETEGLKKGLSIPIGAKIITYLGSVGGWYMTKEMFSFFKLLLEEDDSYHMLILTKDDPEKVKQEAAAMNIPSSKLTITYSDRKTLPLYLALSWCSIFFIRNSFSKIASSPTKHAELMGMGIPVVCNDIGDTGFIIEETGTGILVNTLDDESLREAVIKIKDIKSIAPEKIRECALQYFDLEAGANKYLNVYQQMLSKSKAPSFSLHA